MQYDLDTLIDRRCTESAKWRRYGDDVLPLWVADMDFPSPEPVVRALCERVEHGIFGYATEPDALREVTVERLARRYGWNVSPEALVFIPGVVTGLNMACHAVAEPGGSVFVQTPVYGPFLGVASHAGMEREEMALTRQADGTYCVDMDLMAAAMSERCRAFLLCNPHNPVGRVYREDELADMAALCLERGAVIVSDEIHCDFVYDGHRHVPIASLSPEVAARTITLLAPSKTYNVAGLCCAVAIIPDPELRRAFSAARRGLVPGVNVMGYVAALAAYRDGQEWLDQVLAYLQANRDHLAGAVAEALPGVSMAVPEGTYLGWLDCRAIDLPGGPGEFFLREAKVALGDGAGFGPGGEGFVRLNYGCCRGLLDDALARMARALEVVPVA
ncbi:MAG: pyridoxal phosphate-dependent aminotransferase [Chloroflexi bacterium]|nr:pyridoxal phosphate-dependent aminotransferase [Chloroflexota bacterium]